MTFLPSSESRKVLFWLIISQQRSHFEAMQPTKKQLFHEAPLRIVLLIKNSPAGDQCLKPLMFTRGYTQRPVAWMGQI